METKKLTFSALLVAMGTIAGTLVYIPVGVAKCFPVQLRKKYKHKGLL